MNIIRAEVVDIMVKKWKCGVNCSDPGRCSELSEQLEKFLLQLCHDEWLCASERRDL